MGHERGRVGGVGIRAHQKWHRDVPVFCFDLGRLLRRHDTGRWYRQAITACVIDKLLPILPLFSHTAKPIGLLGNRRQYFYPSDPDESLYVSIFEYFIYLLNIDSVSVTFA